MGPTSVDTGDYYYDEPAKLTFDLADILVERYLREKAETRHVIRANHILSAFDYPENPHNHCRVSKALGERCEKYEGNGDFGPMRFVVPEDYV